MVLSTFCWASLARARMSAPKRIAGSVSVDHIDEFEDAWQCVVGRLRGQGDVAVVGLFAGHPGVEGRHCSPTIVGTALRARSFRSRLVTRRAWVFGAEFVGAGST